MNVQDLLNIADAYKAAAGVDRDSNVSHRVFGDTKKLAALRAGADITVGRYNLAMRWFSENWPSGHQPPSELVEYCSGALANPDDIASEDAA